MAGSMYLHRRCCKKAKNIQAEDHQIHDVVGFIGGDFCVVLELETVFRSWALSQSTSIDGSLDRSNDRSIDRIIDQLNDRSTDPTIDLTDSLF